MTKTRTRARRLEKGDWVVHRHYGVGQVQGVVKRTLNGKNTSFYRITTNDSIVYVPIEDQNGPRIRRVVSRAHFGRAMRTLQRPPNEMSADHNERKRYIRSIKDEGSLLAICRLVRDLSARRESKRLNTTEERALRQLRRQIVGEWSICREVPVEDARKQLNDLLNEIAA